MKKEYMYILLETLLPSDLGLCFVAVVAMDTKAYTHVHTVLWYIAFQLLLHIIVMYH